MNDPAFSLLAAAINSDGRSSLLWVVDENCSPQALQTINARPGLHVVTNRVDISNQLAQRGFSVQLSDFLLSKFSDQSIDAIYYRISKEKPIVHHVINGAGSCLKTGGELLLAGCKQEGIKTYAEKAAGYLSGATTKQRGPKTSTIIALTRGERLGERLDDRNYRGEIAIVDADNVSFASKPGVYGWNKIDKGSELLVSQLAGFLESVDTPPQSVLDIGCGYGYLSVKASRLFNASFVATDNNLAAVELCKKNFSRHQVRGEVVLADCAQGIEQRFDLVLCNPPFHQGFTVEGELTEKFLQAARRRLHAGGHALFVVNSFIALEKKARSAFSGVRILHNDTHFKVLLLTP